MSEPTNKAVFLSYASQDAEAARRICESLHAAGVEVWFDQSELRGGDSWDAKIRKQIKECALFVPIISANTQARLEGYFRLEWKLAEDRSHLMARGKPFVVPVTIDGTTEREAHVPDSFLTVQWTRLPAGETSSAFSERVQALLGGGVGSRPPTAASSPDAAEVARAPGKARRRTGLMAVAATVIALAALALWHPWRGASADSSAAAVQAFPRDPELARAWKLIMDINVTNQDALFAEEIVKPLVLQRPTDAEAAIVYAWVTFLLWKHGDEQVEERWAVEQRYADRAVQLAPKNPWALAAQARSLRGEPQRAEKLARQALALKPDEPHLYFVLAGTLPAGEARIKVMEEAVARFPTNAMLHFRLSMYCLHFRPEQAERELDRAIDLAPIIHAMADKSHDALGRGDLATIKAMLDRMPEKALASDRALFWRYVYASVSGEAEAGLQALRQFPNVWVRDMYYAGPKSFLTGELLLVAGKPEAARLQFEGALTAVRAELARQPANPSLRAAEMWTLLRLGRTVEARAIRDAIGARVVWPLGALWFGEWQLNLLLDRRDEAIARLRMRVSMGRGPFSLRHLLDLDPRLTPWRHDPEIKAMIEEAEKPAAASASDLPASAPGKPDPKSIVVLPFANLSGDPAQEYFSDGVTEEILNALMRERDLIVMPRTSAFSFKDKKLTLAEIARALNVAQVVDGSVRRAGNQVRINCTVTRAADNFPQPLPQFVREMKDATDIFALQEDVARAVVGKLTQRATTAAPVAVLTKNSEAWEAFLRGRDLMNQTSPSWPKGVEAFRRAVELDPQFAMAWAKLGQLSASLYAYGFDGKALGESERALREALRLGPDLREVHLAQAFFLRATDAAHPAIERALAAAGKDRADDPEVLQIRGEILLAQGNGEEGIRTLQRAAIVDARNGPLLNMLGNALTASGRYEEAETVYRQAFEILGSSIPWTNRASVYFHGKGDIALATRTLDEAPEGLRNERYWTSRALLLYMMGDQSGALSAASHMQQRSAFFRIRPFFTAKMREASGDAEGARRDYLEALPLAEQQRDEFATLSTPHAILASVYAGLDRKAEALEAAHKAVAMDQSNSDPNSAVRRDGRERTGVGALTLVDLELSSEAALARVQARFGLIDEALAIVATNVAAGHWRRNNLLRNPDWAILRKDPRFREIAEKAPL